jgi:hypothetical protein
VRHWTATLAPWWASPSGDGTAPVFGTCVVGIKIDTQGVEPEIFLGARTVRGAPDTDRGPL